MNTNAAVHRRPHAAHQKRMSKHRSPQPQSYYPGRHRAPDHVLVQVWRGVVRAVVIISGLTTPLTVASLLVG